MDESATGSVYLLSRTRTQEAGNRAAGPSTVSTAADEFAEDAFPPFNAVQLERRFRPSTPLTQKGSKLRPDHARRTNRSSHQGFREDGAW
jgi:hypothetical protein